MFLVGGEMRVVKQVKPARRKNVNLAYELNGKPVSKQEGKVIALEVSRSLRERQDREQQVRAFARRPRAEEAASVRFAMRAIEQRIVRGLWVLEISQAPDGPREANRNGLEYMRERLDHFAAGEWQHGTARPPVPSSKEIDAAREAQSWIGFLDEGQARLLTVAAMTKRGERTHRVLWQRVRDRIPQVGGCKLRTLQDRYDRALREIVAHLSIGKLA